ncbi:MAG: hypothetical protein JNK40_02900 [Chromatiales bacterium]|nr:hypothetical protein [Chromatiales bacterium]
MPALQIGAIYRHREFYSDPATGELLPKFFLVLAHTPGDDIVARLLTSQAHGRRESPPCFHGDPYPGYYLGVLGGPLGSKSWLDLRFLGDLDDAAAAGQVRRGVLAEALRLPAAALRPVLECVAGANDTTRLQARSIRDQLASMN